MEKMPLMNELTQGRELANQLKSHLDKTISPQTCELLVENILSSYEKVLSMLNPAVDEAPAAADSYSYSPHHCNKKRKTMEKWSEQVKVCSGNMVEGGPLSDGYSWRKYGQKDILGANHPRAYYRCTHRNVQGCLATKQVQRSDEDSSVFEVSYMGRHTCTQATQLSKALEKKPKKEEESIIEKKCMDRVFSFKAYKGGEEGLFPCFSFASTPIETEKLENLFCDFNHNLQSSDSDLSDIINNSTPNSVTNSPFGGCDLDLDLDFSLDHVDFDVTDPEMFA